MRITASGDFLAQTEIPRDKGFFEVKDYVSKSDVAFTNLETTVFKDGTKGIFGNQFSGGSYLHADPSVLNDVKAYGFNMLSFANNHSFDFGLPGFLETYRNVKESGLASAGAGLSLKEASKPVYVNTKEGVVALVSVNSTIGTASASTIAGNGSKNFEARPGVNPLRAEERIMLSHSLFNKLKEEFSEGLINADQEFSRAEGYTAAEKEGELTLRRTVKFIEGDSPAFISYPNKEDLDRLINSIKEAREKADYVLVSIHAHTVVGKSKEEVCDFLKEAAHSCIDAGADAILGHGPHIIRAVELYNGKPVFYSLGDFILQTEFVETAPAEFFEKIKVPVDSSMTEMFLKRSNNGKRGLRYTKEANESVIASLVYENKKLKDVEFYPIEMGLGKDERKGCPAFAPDMGILERLQELSKPFGSEITIDSNGLGHLKISG